MKLPVKRRWWEFYKSPWSKYIPGGIIGGNNDNQFTGIALSKRHPDRLTNEEFSIEVQKRVSNTDFNAFRSHLDKIEPKYHKLYLFLITLGYPINLNPAIFIIFDKIKLETDLLDREMINLLPKYELINLMLVESKIEYARRS